MNAFEQLRDLINDLILDHWVKALVAVAALAATTLFGAVKAWHAIKKRTFYRRFHFSLNIIQNGTLLLRTLDEMDALDVILNNKEAVGQLIKGAKRTTVENPFIDLGKDLHWLVLNAALNELARIIPCTGLFHQNLGLPVRKERYVIGLTCEKDPDVRSRKVRLMIIREQALQEILADEYPEPRVEFENHKVRWKTLKIMAKRYVLLPEQFMAFEVVLPLYK